MYGAGIPEPVAGSISSDMLADGAVSVAKLASAAQARLLTYLEPWERTSRMNQTVNSTRTLTADLAYFIYQGRTTQAATWARVYGFLTTVAAGTVASEIGLFSTPAAPNGASQTVTKLVATDTLDDLVSASGKKGNASAFATLIPAGTYLWAGIRAQYGTTQPTFTALQGDFASGGVLTTATAGALTGAGPWTGSPFGAVAGATGPALLVTLD